MIMQPFLQELCYTSFTSKPQTGIKVYNTAGSK